MPDLQLVSKLNAMIAIADAQIATGSEYWRGYKDACIKILTEELDIVDSIS